MKGHPHQQNREALERMQRDMDKRVLCTCGAAGNEPHICPFADEIHGSKDECTCCDHCTEQCARDI